MEQRPGNDHEQRQGRRQSDRLIARLRREAAVRDAQLSDLQARLAEAERELDDLRAIRDALTPSELPERPGVQLAAAFVPAAERVSGDFYLVAEGPQDSTVLVVGDVVGHGLHAAQRAAFVRTAFASTAPFSDDPRKLLRWANAALVDRAGTSADFVTAACMTYLPGRQLLRWAYAGHPPALGCTKAQSSPRPRRACRSASTRSPTTSTRRCAPSRRPAYCSTPTGSPRRAATASSSGSPA
jgi:serine phosphatase RsbU (regulator of sigma subunit)